MKENNYTVYMHVNKINNKKYIGITCRRPEERWKSGHGYDHNRYFSRAIKKVGWKNFNHLILHTNLTKRQAEQKEIELIAKYKTNQRKYGYNISNGGDHKGKHSQETIELIRKKNVGKTSWCKGLKMSKEFCKKNREAHKKHFVPVVRLTKEGIFLKEYETTKDASLDINVSTTSITRTCKGTQCTTGGFIFLYKGFTKQELNERIKRINEHRDKIMEFKKGNTPWNAGRKGIYNEEQLETMSKERSNRFKNPDYLKIYCKPVEQIDLKTGKIINEYISSAEAERQIGIQGVGPVCRGKRKTAGGYGWKFKENK